MTWRLGCDAADLFAAIGPNAADSGHLHDPEGANPDCGLGGNKVSVVNLHGDNDSNVPYYGGAGCGAEPYVRQPVEDPVTDPQNPINQLYGEQTDIGLWTGLNGCAFVPPVDVDTQTGYEKTTWCAAGSGVQVVNYRMIGDGHIWFITPNSALSSTDVTWAFFENATVSVTLFSDGFESGNFTEKSWGFGGGGGNNSPQVRTQADYAGSYGARLRGSSWISQQLNTVGYAQASLKFWRRTAGLDANQNEVLKLEWSINGGSWTSSGWETRDTVWNEATVALPAGQSDLRIRFTTNADRPLLERGDIDEVVVTGS